jgi:hypothetical protein
MDRCERGKKGGEAALNTQGARLGKRLKRALCQPNDASLPRNGFDIENFSFGAVSRILFHALRRFGRHFSRALAGPPERPRGANPAEADGCDIPETMGRAVQSPILSCTGRGFSSRTPRGVRGGLLPHLFTLARRFRGTAGRSVFCDTIRRRGLNRAACACLSARAASCPAVSGLSSPNFYRARRYPRLGIKELGATTSPKAKGTSVPGPGPFIKLDKGDRHPRLFPRCGRARLRIPSRPSGRTGRRARIRCPSPCREPPTRPRWKP